MAYTNSNISGQDTGCAIWFGDLIDIAVFFLVDKIYIIVCGIQNQRLWNGVNWLLHLEEKRLDG
ncbi:hypothetical protein PanWU01x14_205500 [Parasponia andersonii]|uniref:Uncharacterized protein n=1 Tax=Parasponia andersonii TaxID=3476 RepID=A0A2P5BW42_PARAD|nr:hypothetical protein PanWU01x14_205500 [Parasponia andersonii]